MPEKGVVPPGLKPKEAVKVPKELFKKLPEEIKVLLRKLNETRESGDKEAQRKVRMDLRKKGFYLSNIEAGGVAPTAPAAPAKAPVAPVVAGKKKPTTPPVEKEEEDEEEDD